MDASIIGSKNSPSRSSDKVFYGDLELENIALPTTKISLSNLPANRGRRSLLPLVVTAVVFVGAFFVGNNLGGFFWPNTLPLHHSIAVVGEKSLASAGVVGKKIVQNIKDDKKTTVTPADLDKTIINDPEPSLNQSWRELVASVSVGGSKLSLFGEQLWNVIANKTAYTVDWLAYGVVGPQEKMVEVVNSVKVSLIGEIGSSLNNVSARMASSSMQVKESALAMSSQSEVLDNFDQRTTIYLSGLVSGLGKNILTFGQLTRDGLIFVNSASKILPGEITIGVSKLFWQPLAEKTDNITNGALSIVGLKEGVADSVVAKSIGSMSGLLTGFSENTKVGYEYFAHLSGQTNSQVAAVKFLSITESSKELFLMIGDRIKAVWNWFVKFFSNLWQTAVSNWKTFFGLAPKKETVQVVQPKIDDAMLADLQEKIKNDLRNDLRQEIADIVRRTSANNLSDKTSEGLVVVSSTGSKEGDDKLKAEIQKMFSDRVTVDLDANRKAGVITPVFDPSENYIFLLAPVKK